MLITLLVASSSYATGNDSRAIRHLGAAVEPIFAPQEIDQADLTMDTLHYEGARTENFFTIPDDRGDDSLWVRFDPPDEFGRFGIWGFGIRLVEIPRRFGGPNGEPDMSVTVYESGQFNDELGFPTNPIDGINIPFQFLRFDTVANLPYKYYDLRDLGIGFNAARPFHIVISIITHEQGEKFGLFCDDAADSTDRSGLKDGDNNEWAKLMYLDGIRKGYNFAIRAVIADSIGNGVFELDPYTGSLLPLSAELQAAFPNPFNSTSRLEFGVPIGTPYRVALFDPLGRQRAELADGIGNGRGFISLDAGNLAAGVYMVRLWTPYSIKSQRVMLVR